MVRLRHRERKIAKLESLYTKYGEMSIHRDFCQKFAKSFSCSAGRAGKPIVKWTEVQSWFQNRLQVCPVRATPPSKNVEEMNPSHDLSNLGARVDDSDSKKTNATNLVHKAGKKIQDLSELKFEAKSSTDGAWYDVERFITHRFTSSGEAEVRVRFVGFGPDEDEWINVKNDVRERSIPLENWECQKVNVGDVKLCLQERKDQAVYYDARILDIKRKMHDIRGCRCIFLIQYNHDDIEESVRLQQLCHIQ
ncbi:protein SAWADEE HOMEODOMAIN HOMOLOG 1-like isoform X2 [Silene latifolia]|uniref:protein SAWADEE HOMEODOMAIN HOMOLOG 1-like isoform X2 n=1 Tax=Silene latifolia TaxID=37657 RepID=UPI003D7755CE